MEGKIEPCLWDWDLSDLPEADLSDVSNIIAADVVYEGTGECRLSHALLNLCQGPPKRSAWLMLAERAGGGEMFAPLPQLDEGIDPTLSPRSGRKLIAVERFLYACARRGLNIKELPLDKIQFRPPNTFECAHMRPTWSWTIL